MTARKEALTPEPEARSTAELQGRRQASYRFNNDLRYSDGTDMRHRQMTPAYVLDPVRAALGGIGLDPCTEPDNPTGAERFYTVDDDGLTQSWRGADWLPTVYCNPPYTKAREPWVDRCIEAGKYGQRVVLLIPAHTDTRLFQRALATATTVLFVKGRVKFGVLRENRRQEAASHPSALIGWNLDLQAVCAHLGLVVSLWGQSPEERDRMTADIIHSAELPDDAMPVSVIEIVSYLVGDGDQQFCVRVGGRPQLSSALGLIELSKDSIMRAYMGEDNGDVGFE